MASGTCHLVTGFPGFLGRRLVARLLGDDDGARVVALVESRMMQPARQAAAELPSAASSRLELLASDITQRGLGLEPDRRRALLDEVTTAFHLAAIYDLAVPLELAQRVNVEGTGNVLELCGECRRLERLNYVGTAYVAGDRHGVVYEHELALGQRFKNHYESTKFQAEVWVRAEMGRIPTTIHRPAIVVGDSRTGETQKFDGPYYLLRVIAVSQRRGSPIPQFGRSAAAFNVVPVDFVIEAMLAAAADEQALGRTLHLVDPEPVSTADLLRLLSMAYAGKGPGYRVPPKLVEAGLHLAPVRELFAGAPAEGIRYLNHSVRFDTRAAGDVLARRGLPVPRFADYVGAVVDFFRAHEDDPAFAPRHA